MERDLKELIFKAGNMLLNSNRAKPIKTEKWQGLKVDQEMVEVFDLVLRAPVPGTVQKVEMLCNPDLPWAEDHFMERIGKDPTNPGSTFQDWPYYCEGSYRQGDIFTHTYQERIWPKYANGSNPIDGGKYSNWGIRYGYGDLDDVIRHLAFNPSTRQAFLPIWFPEDTGITHGGRVPCTLGYLFSYREGFIHITYYIRSCDYIRHFKNDVYFTARMLLHVLEECRKIGETPINWKTVSPGRMKMDIESLHIFKSDTYELKKRLRNI
jgi:hypothetical protein